MRNVQIHNAHTTIAATVSNNGGTNLDCYVDAYPECLGNATIRYNGAVEGTDKFTTPTVTTASGTAIITVTKTAHGCAVGDLVDFYNFNTTNLQMLYVNAPFYQVATVADADHFTVVNPTNNATGDGSDATGTIWVYRGGKWTNAIIPRLSGIKFNDCQYQTLSFVVTQAAAGANVIMLCNGQENIYFDEEFYVVEATLSVNNANASVVGTYAYIYSPDSVASRFTDCFVSIPNPDISQIGVKRNSVKFMQKLFSGMGLRARLWDTTGSGATYPRNFVLDIKVAKTGRSPA